MSLGTSFNTSGATPFALAPKKAANPFAAGSTPVANALNMFSQPTVKTPVPVAAPDKGIKSHETNADGSVKVTYHAPDNGLTESQVKSNINSFNQNNPTQTPGLINSSSYQTGGDPNASPNLVGTKSVEGTSSSNYPTTGGLIPTPAQNNASGMPQNAYGQAVGGLLNRGTQDSPEVVQAREALKANQMARANSVANNRMNPIPLEFQQGRERVLTDQYLAQENALSSQLNSAVTTQGQQNSALQNAGSLASPVQVPYSNQFIDPVTGQPRGGGNGGNLGEAVKGVVEKLGNGQMIYNDALTALSGYGQGGVNALQQALPAGFNIAQSNTLGAQQGSIRVNYQLAQNALSNVENLMKDLGFAQGTNIPAVNAVGNYISTQTGLGSEQTRAVTGAVQSLRNAYASLLASSKGGTPTDYSSQAIAEIPNNPTPNDIAAIKKNMETLGKARADILGNPGTSGTSSSGGQVTAGGFSFKQDANGNWIPA